jgi:hypothetical protein
MLNTTYTRTIYTRDSYGTPQGENLYGAHPVYFDHWENGTHGVFLLNSNGMDIFIDKEAGRVENQSTTSTVLTNMLTSIHVNVNPRKATDRWAPGRAP